MRLVDGDSVGAERAVICNVTPTQLYGRLLDAADVPAEIADAGKRFRFGRCDMQIHFALSEPPRWEGDERLDKTAIVHLTPGLDGVSRAVNEADRGLLPTRDGRRRTATDNRRLACPGGQGILWIQLQELPWHVKGDAAGSWTSGTALGRVPARGLRGQDPGTDREAHSEPRILDLRRVVLSPADLQKANINLERGDPYSGSLALDQNFLWRPFARQPGHRTSVDRLFHIGASTWPGPGLGAGSGTLVAKALLQPPAAQRLVGRLSTFVRQGQA